MRDNRPEGQEGLITAGDKKMREVLDWIIHIAIAIVVGVLIVMFVGQRTIVHDISMEPTLKEGDNLLVEKLGFRFGWLHRGDIIVFKPPYADRQLIKRLVAVEGDKVEIKDGKVYVNGKISLIGRAGEPGTQLADNSERSVLTVPDGYIYVLGDNRPFSEDSSERGPIEKNCITGRAVYRFFPFNKIGSIGNEIKSKK